MKKLPADATPGLVPSPDCGVRVAPGPGPENEFRTGA